VPKLTPYPGLRRHIRVSKAGRAKVYYYLDRRAEGLSDLPLGTDFDEAVRQWDDYRNQRPRIRGTLEEAFAGWEKEVLPTYENAGTKKNYRLSLKRLREVFATATCSAKG